MSGGASVPQALGGEKKEEEEEGGGECVSQTQWLAWTKYHTAQLIKTEDSARGYRGATAIGLLLCLALCTLALVFSTMAYNAATATGGHLAPASAWGERTIVPGGRVGKRDGCVPVIACNKGEDTAGGGHNEL